MLRVPWQQPTSENATVIPPPLALPRQPPVRALSPRLVRGGDRKQQRGYWDQEVPLGLTPAAREPTHFGGPTRVHRGSPRSRGGGGGGVAAAGASSYSLSGPPSAPLDLFSIMSSGDSRAEVKGGEGGLGSQADHRPARQASGTGEGRSAAIMRRDRRRRSRWERGYPSSSITSSSLSAAAGAGAVGAEIMKGRTGEEEGDSLQPALGLGMAGAEGGEGTGLARRVRARAAVADEGTKTSRMVSRTTRDPTRRSSAPSKPVTITCLGKIRHGATAAEARGSEDMTCAGLRSTHFAPGYLGVAWPDPLAGGAEAARQSTEARARILTRLEEAAARKLAELEERTQRARGEMSERRKRRWEVFVFAWTRFNGDDPSIQAWCAMICVFHIYAGFSRCSRRSCAMILIAFFRMVVGFIRGSRRSCF